jgi:hypothetical protein
VDVYTFYHLLYIRKHQFFDLRYEMQSLQCTFALFQENICRLTILLQHFLKHLCLLTVILIELKQANEATKDRNADYQP